MEQRHDIVLDNENLKIAIKHRLKSRGYFHKGKNAFVYKDIVDDMLRMYNFEIRTSHLAEYLKVKHITHYELKRKGGYISAYDLRMLAKLLGFEIKLQISFEE